jgi:hypothetical protein
MIVGEAHVQFARVHDLCDATMRMHSDEKIIL